MKRIEALLKKIRKQAKDKDATYLYGVEYSSNTKPGYKAMVRFTKHGVPPVIFAADTEDKLEDSILEYLGGEDVKDINIRYHQEQIELERQAIRFHENLIKDYANPHTELPTE